MRERRGASRRIALVLNLPKLQLLQQLRDCTCDDNVVDDDVVGANGENNDDDDGGGGDVPNLCKS